MINDEDSYMTSIVKLRAKVKNGEHVVLEDQCLTCDNAYAEAERIKQRAVEDHQIAQREAEDAERGHIDQLMDEARERATMPEYTEW